MFLILPLDILCMCVYTLLMKDTTQATHSTEETKMETPKLDRYLRVRGLTGQDIPGKCWDLANAKMIRMAPIAVAERDRLGKIQNRTQDEEKVYRNLADECLKVWMPLFEKIAIKELVKIHGNTWETENTKVLS